MESADAQSGAAEPYLRLHWLPLGADGNPLVRLSGKAYEAIAAARQHRPRTPLYHSALSIRLDRECTYVIEMAPVWALSVGDRGVVHEGAVGLPWLRHLRAFRYEIRRWPGGYIPDLAQESGHPVQLSSAWAKAKAALDLVDVVPVPTWGLDELGAGEMWNSNSVIAWILTSAGFDAAALTPPGGGRAPGWSAGVTVAHLTHQAVVPSGHPQPCRRAKVS